MRSWLGIGLLAALLLFGFGAGYIIESFHSPTAQYLEKAAEAAQNDDGHRAAALLKRAEDRWQRYRHRTAALTDHNPMDQIEDLFAETGTLAQLGQWQTVAARCRQLAAAVDSVCQDQQLTWWNLL